MLSHRTVWGRLCQVCMEKQWPLLQCRRFHHLLGPFHPVHKLRLPMPSHRTLGAVIAKLYGEAIANVPLSPLSPSPGTPLVQTWADQEYKGEEDTGMLKDVVFNDMPDVHEFDPGAESDDAKDSSPEEGGQLLAETYLPNLVESYADKRMEQRRKRTLATPTTRSAAGWKA